MPFPALHERIGVSWCGEDDVAVDLEQKGRLVLRHASRFFHGNAALLMAIHYHAFYYLTFQRILRLTSCAPNHMNEVIDNRGQLH